MGIIYVYNRYLDAMKSMVTFMSDLLTCDHQQHIFYMLVIVEVESLCVHTDTENAFVLILSVNTRNSTVTTFQVLKEMSNNWPPIYLMLNGDIFSQFSNKFPSTCSSVDALDHRIYFWNSKVTWTFIIYVWGMRNNENEQFAGCFLIFSDICFKIRWHGETYISVKDTTSATNAGFIQFYRKVVCRQPW